MALTLTSNQKKSLAITTSFFALLFLVFALIKLTDVMSPPLLELEGGGGGGDVMVNFGDSEFGQGTDYESREPVQAKAKAAAPVESRQEEVVTSDNDEAPTVADIKKATENPKKEVPKEQPKPERRPDKSTSNALSDILNGSSTGGDGNDGRAGNKGQAGGSTEARGYDGGGGSGTGSGGGNGSGQGIGTGSGYGSGNGGGSGSGSGNWRLAGRKLASSGKVVQDCNEYGTVVVEIRVNRQGNVIGTKAVKGTTNTAKCLTDAAFATARKYKWNANPEAAETQIGTITINFSLGE